MNELVEYRSSLCSLQKLLGLGCLHILEKEELLPYIVRILSTINGWLIMEDKEGIEENLKLVIGYYEDGLEKIVEKGRLRELLEDYGYGYVVEEWEEKKKEETPQCCLDCKMKTFEHPFRCDLEIEEEEELDPGFSVTPEEEERFKLKLFLVAWTHIFTTIYLEAMYNYSYLFTESALDCHECCGTIGEDEDGNLVFTPGSTGLGSKYLGSCGCGAK